jgi:hypothetical protein
MSVESISTINQRLFVNSDLGPAVPNSLRHANAETSEDAPHDTKQQVIKAGSQQAMSDAEAIFARANSYSDVSGKVQKSLQAYEAIEVSLKREALSQLMGVDLYA